MKRFFYVCLAVLFVVTTILPLAACQPDNSPDEQPAKGTFSYVTNEQMSETDYNKNLYYLNQLKFQIADPDVIYVDHGEERGWFYAYGTSDLVNCFGIQCWRSRDLTNWEYKGVAYMPNFDNTWDYTNHWAPEVLFDAEQDLYLLFFNADNINAGNKKCIDVAYSENPYGPFVSYTPDNPKPAYDFSSSNKQIDPALTRQDTIDVHPFVDPQTGDKYLYYSGYGRDGNGTWHGQTIFGVKMKDWLTPDYSTLKELTHLYKTTVNDDAEDIDEGRNSGASVNEGPYVYYQDGTYYMTFSVYPYTSEMYQVRQAVATSPLGDFVKLQPDEGGMVIGTDGAWSGFLSSAGHHCFIKCGDALMIAYHTFYNRTGIDEGRALAVDKVVFVDNGNGQKVMHANGPTYSYQPLPEEISGYANVAESATISVNNVAEGSSVASLNDGVLKVHSNDPVAEFRTSGGKTVITLMFDNFVMARSLMIYNSTDYDLAFWGVNSVKLYYKSSETGTSQVETSKILLDDEWNADTFSEVMYPGANTIVEFDELPVNKVEITINAAADQQIAMNEIVLLGRYVENPAPVAEFVEYSYSEPVFGEALPVYESNTFGKAGEFVSNYGYDLSHDDGTENAYVDKVWCGNQQMLYFKDVVSNNFYVEAELSVLNHTKAYNNDKYPKIGLMMRARNNYFVFFNIDCTADYNGKAVGWVQSNAAGNDYLWGDYAAQSKVISSIDYTGDSFVKLAIARIDGKCWMFVNDQLAFALEGEISFNSLQSTACAVSFLTYNSFTRFRNYSITDNVNEVKAKLLQLNVTVD
ncbi:MAG: family 43 glycosylhydrolase [Candidatus Fimimonas sp.]